MFYSKLFLMVLLILGTKPLIAQSFSSAKELKRYYKENCNQFHNPEEGWNDAWIILPDEREFVTDLEGEVVEAKVFVDHGEIKHVFYQGNSYHEGVYSTGPIKKGKGAFQKVILDINDDLTEVFTAYTHDVIFKVDNSSTASPLKIVDTIGEATFFSSENKIEKHGFYVFVENHETQHYDFIGYLNDRCDNASACTSDNSLNFLMKEGNYEIIAVKDKIQVNRQMPIQKISITIDREYSKIVELSTIKNN
ncbi:hypothetical protein [Flammeovirga aprica]|uniref:Uncharacterized protein n=1 Tax=Flammeovirga aprica JL-4 TaxID=694437 RepID=A0A7X9XAL6_9BACT|nr:hypothetical protein [Flammeovirga aprica]NME69805.1 hypothetical protein [Flammeovirga aprica JL-4]